MSLATMDASAQWCRNWRGPWLVYWKGDRKPSFGNTYRAASVFSGRLTNYERRFAQQ
jgi:hypothetical protein